MNIMWQITIGKNSICTQNLRTFSFVGAVRVKQVRVTNDDCRISASLQNVVKFCYSREPNIDKTAFGPGNIYTWSDDPEEASFDSVYNRHTYPRGGFIQDFTLNLTLASASAKVTALEVTHKQLPEIDY
jgi:hypothetical protein